MNDAFKQIKHVPICRSRHVALVGNGPSAKGHGALIDGCDAVIRFNKANGWRTDTGERMDVLTLVNHGGQMAEWLDDGSLTSMDQVRAASTIALPVPLMDGHLTGTQARGTDCDVDRVNFIGEASERLAALGKAVVRFELDDYTTAVARLRAVTSDDAPLYPSTGFLMLSRLLEREPQETRFTLFGFGFKGWSGHPWALERECVRRFEGEGRVVIV